MSSEAIPFDTPMAFQTPRLISDVSAWIQHIPFAFALIEMLKPRRLVELGTFTGDSYCAFCQAVEMLQLETECTAVDTWEGDAQAGVYDDHVFQALAGYHDPLYGRFSKLIRSSFDDAIGRFADGSIDLLHIDGLHTYAAVRHDFETWRPKLSDKAVVLMHDIDVREGDFGVYRFWEELRPHYPHFEFLHGYGLGVLLVGKQVPTRMQQFISAAEKSPETVRRCFHALGQRLELGRGVALLAKDVARQEARANEWKAMRKQPLRDLLPTDLGVGAFLEEGPFDVKRNIDRIHETSMNHLDDMNTIAADNRNLLSQMEELQALANLAGGPSEAPVIKRTRVSVVIPTLNGGKLFAELVPRLRSQTHLPEEIIIIDSGSTDDTLQTAQDFGVKILSVSRGEFDHGLTRNIGISQTTGDIIVLMTQDAVPQDEHMIQAMLESFSDSTVAGVFSRQIPRAEHDVLVARNILTWITGQTAGRVSQIEDMAAYQKMSSSDRFQLCVFDNVCSAVRRSVWEQFPFQKAAFGEDIEWSKRVLEAGWKIVFEPRASVIHSHQRSARYEYRRTYMCHRALFRLFGLCTIPNLTSVSRCFLKSTTDDWGYILRNERRMSRKLGLCLKVPALSWGSVWGQYKGARDEREGRGKNLADV